MGKAFIVAIMLCLFGALPARADSDMGKVLIEGVYGMSSVNPSDLNDYRSNFLWNNTTATQGTFNNLTYFGASVGVHVTDPLYVSIRYEQSSQSLPATAITGLSGSVTDSFDYNPIYLDLDFPIISGGGWMVTLGGGVGYALDYAFHQKNTFNNEDVVWEANPIGYRGRASLAYMFGANVGLFAECIYESISSSSMKTPQSYVTTINGTAITSGQTLTDKSGSATTVNMSGFHYGAGLRLLF